MSAALSLVPTAPASSPSAQAREAAEMAYANGNLELANVYYLLADAYADRDRSERTSERRRVLWLASVQQVTQLERDLDAAAAEIGRLKIGGRR